MISDGESGYKIVEKSFGRSHQHNLGEQDIPRKVYTMRAQKAVSPTGLWADGGRVSRCEPYVKLAGRHVWFIWRENTALT